MQKKIWLRYSPFRIGRHFVYAIKFYQGEYRERQEAANRDKCVGYVEHHFNSSDSPSSNYAVVITGANASQTSKNWGRWYAQAVAREFNIPLGGDQGIKVGGYDGRGDYNLKFTNMPAVLLEPLFASSPQHAEWIKSDGGQVRLAQILSESIQRFFPSGGALGFSVGHKHKTSNPNDGGRASSAGATSLITQRSSSRRRRYFSRLSAGSSWTGRSVWQ